MDTLRKGGQRKPLWGGDNKTGVCSSLRVTVWAWTGAVYQRICSLRTYDKGEECLAVITANPSNL